MRAGTGTALVVLALILLAGTARASDTSKLPRGKLNPRTGRPVVSHGPVALPDSALAALIAQVGFRDQAKALAIAKRESGGFFDVVVDTRGMTRDELVAFWGFPARAELSVGLWQINLLANAALVPGATLEEKIAAMQNPEVNARVAFGLSNGGTSWGPWGG